MGKKISCKEKKHLFRKIMCANEAHRKSLTDCSLPRFRYNDPPTPPLTLEDQKNAKFSLDFHARRVGE